MYIHIKTFDEITFFFPQNVQQGLLPNNVLSVFQNLDDNTIDLFPVRGDLALGHNRTCQPKSATAYLM